MASNLFRLYMIVGKRVVNNKFQESTVYYRTQAEYVSESFCSINLRAIR